MTRVEVPPPSSDSLIRSVMERRTRDDGTSEIVSVDQFASVDGEWVNIRDLIDVWREAKARPAFKRWGSIADPEPPPPPR